jgi:hypothetical protein
MKWKEGVTLHGTRRELRKILRTADMLFKGKGEVLTITSTTDGKHKANSLHYMGLAADIRTRDLKSHTPEGMAETLRNFLPIMDPRVQVILEPTHIHIEIERRQKVIYDETTTS